MDLCGVDRGIVVLSCDASRVFLFGWAFRLEVVLNVSRKALLVPSGYNGFVWRSGAGVGWGGVESEGITI